MDRDARPQREAHGTQDTERGSRSPPEAIVNMNGKPCKQGGPPCLPITHMRKPVTTGGLRGMRCPTTAGGSRYTGHGKRKPVITGGHHGHEWEALQARRPRITATHTCHVAAFLFQRHCFMVKIRLAQGAIHHSAIWQCTANQPAGYTKWRHHT